MPSGAGGRSALRMRTGLRAGAGAAVANAIYNACGVRLRDYPMSPDKVLAGLLAKGM